MNKNYREILLYFLRLGCLGFGGPLSLVSMIQKDCIEDKKWMTQNEFQSAFSLIKALPGPVAFMSSVFVGNVRGGFWGGLLAGIGVVFPAFVMMILLAQFYSQVMHVKGVNFFMLGMQLSAIGVILASLKGLISGFEKNFLFWTIVFLSMLIFLVKPQLEPVMILIFGFSTVFLDRLMKQSKNELGLLFLVCLKAGAVVFGSGLAIIPVLKYDFVTHYQWISEKEFLDALAFGQMTPGPVVIAVTYIGQKLHGLSGAIVATLGIFTASFIHISTWFIPFLKKVQQQTWISTFLVGGIGAVVGPLLASVYKLTLPFELNSLSNMWGYVLIGIVFLMSLKKLIPLWSLIPLGGLVVLVLKTF